MSPFSDPWILDSVGILLAAVGGAGLVALFISLPQRAAMKRVVAVTCAVMAVGGVLLMLRAEALRGADRDLDPAQQASLAHAISRLPNVRFEVFTAHADNETRSLAEKIVEAIRMGTGAAPEIGTGLPPATAPLKGVVLVMHDRQADLGRAVATTIGRVLMAARVAVITDDEISMDDRTVRIIISPKP